MKPVLYEGLQPGGQLTTTNEVENFPGYKDGVTGPEMMIELKDQALRFETDVRPGFINKVDFSGEVHKCWADDGTEIHAETVIISTGASAKYLGLESEQKYLKLGGGVSACAVCDGFFYRGHETVIVGAGDSACEEALFLTRFCSKVTLIHRRDELRASKIMAERTLAHEKIDVVWDAAVEEILAGEDGRVRAIKTKNLKTGNLQEIFCKGVFIAIGHLPNTKPFQDILDLDENGYLVPSNGSMVKTKIPGVFVAGDCADHVYRQAITAAGMGCQSAIEAERWLADSD